MKKILLCLFLISLELMAAGLPVEPKFMPLLWNFENSGQPARWEKNRESGTVGADIKLLEAWKIIDAAPEVKVAIIDGGFNLSHPDLKDEFQSDLQYDFINHNSIIQEQKLSDKWGTTWSNHGQVISGIIGANGFNEIGVTGISRQTKLMPIQAIPGEGNESDDVVASAIRWAVDNKAQIINCSFGKRSTSQVLRSAIEYARVHEVLIVASAGNDSENLQKDSFWPASYSTEFENVISVAATDRNDEIWKNSNYGMNVDIGAPGSEIFSTGIDRPDPKSQVRSDYSTLSGTSMASPHVTGVAALMLQLDPGLKPSEIKKILMETADRPNPLSGKVRSGRLNAARALAVVQEKLIKQDCNFDQSKKILIQNDSGYTAEWIIDDTPELYQAYLSLSDKNYQQYKSWFKAQTNLDARGLLTSSKNVGLKLIKKFNDDQGSKEFISDLKIQNAMIDQINIGAIGAIRKMQCLESIPFREFLKIHSFEEGPMEFTTSFLKKGSKIKILADIYKSEANQMGVAKTPTLKDEFASSIADGWELYIDLHNHPLYPNSPSGDIGGTTAPSAVDISNYLKTSPQKALITNGIETIGLDQKDFVKLKNLTSDQKP